MLLRVTGAHAGETSGPLAFFGGNGGVSRWATSFALGDVGAC